MDLQEIDATHAKLPAGEREEIIRIGRRFGSSFTADQARRTLNAQAEHGPRIAGRGYTPAHNAKLGWCADALAVADVGRLSGRGERKTNDGLLLDAMRRGKVARFDLVALLGGAADDLAEQGGADEDVHAARVVLAQTSSTGADALALAAQLDRLAATADRPAVAAWTTAAEAAGAGPAARAIATELRTLEARTVVPLGTPEETQRLDLIDGTIVRLVRLARRAARAAAKAHGDPALANAFELTALYGAPGGGAPVAPVQP